jgi:general secretion pathway protein E
MSPATFDMFMHPIGFGLFATWWIATLYCVALCQRHANIPVEYRSRCNLLVLLTGPWGMAILLSRFRYPANDRAALEYRDQVEGGMLARWFRRMLGIAPTQVAGETLIELCTPDGRPIGQVDDRFKRSQDSEGLQHAKTVLLDAIENRVSDILIDPRSDDRYSIRLRIDGVLEEREQVSATLAHNMLNCVKIASRMDIAERRRPQDGSFMVKLPQVSFNCRVSTAGTMRGPKAAIRLLDPRAGLRPVKQLGLRKNDLARLLHSAQKKSGMILVCGPTGSGKTTTLYAVLNQFDPKIRNLVTIEDPIEYPLEFATQTEVNEKAGITFSNVLRAMLRQNPDVILVGEVRDAETAELAIQASNTGHLVLTTVHGNDSSAALLRLRDLGVPTRRLAGAVTAVLAQRLVRRLCRHCRQAAELNAEEWQLARKLGLRSPNVFRPGKCQRCRNTGYRGRRGVFELLFANADVNDCLSGDPSLGDLRRAAVGAGMTPMVRHGMDLVTAGITTFEEVIRVCQEN